MGSDEVAYLELILPRSWGLGVLHSTQEWCFFIQEAKVASDSEDKRHFLGNVAVGGGAVVKGSGKGVSQNVLSLEECSICSCEQVQPQTTPTVHSSEL